MNYLLKNRTDFVQYINNHNYKNIVEIGVQSGKFSEVLLDANIDKIYLIDPWVHFDNYIDIANVSNNKHEKLYRLVINKFKLDNRVNIIRSTSESAVNLFEKYSLDFIYIDANHSYDFVKKDIVLWYDKLKSGGTLAGHDYMNETNPAGIFEVKKAVDEFINQYNIKLYLTNEPKWKSWFFIKP